MEKLSVIVPCYNEEKVLPLFYKEIVKIAEKMKKKLEFEFVFVNDGSKDDTLKILKELSNSDSRVRYISFSRNFGKEAAMLAGMENAKGDYITIMDADLQDPPALLPKMFEFVKNEKYDMVGTRRVTRKGEPPIRSFFARCFYKIINKMSSIEMVDGARDYRLMTKQVVDSIISMKEYNRYSKGIFSFVGYNVKWLEYENVERAAGETKWSFWKLFKYAIEGIVAFTTIPLTIIIVLGLIMVFIPIALFVIFIIRYMLVNQNLSSTFLIINSITLLLGILLVCLGIIAQYLSRCYLEIKNRPIYIIKEHDNNEIYK